MYKEELATKQRLIEKLTVYGVIVNFPNLFMDSGGKFAFLPKCVI